MSKLWVCLLFTSWGIVHAGNKANILEGLAQRSGDSPKAISMMKGMGAVTSTVAESVSFTAWMDDSCSFNATKVDGWREFPLDTCSLQSFYRQIDLRAYCLEGAPDAVLIEWYDPSTECNHTAIQGMLRYNRGSCYGCEEFVPGTVLCGHKQSVKALSFDISPCRKAVVV